MSRLPLLLLLLAPFSLAEKPAEAVFAGGCFWCMEPPYDELEGVLETTSGYTGGQVADPSYEEVVAGGTGHYEVVKVTYDPSRVDYQTLLKVFWRNIDPLDPGGQFCDQGHSYRAAIFYDTPEQERLAQASKQKVEARFDQPVVTELLAASEFYPAEEYHQNFYEKNPVRYKYYRFRCGREARLDELWEDR